jgi:hypothetical protein
VIRRLVLGAALALAIGGFGLVPAQAGAAVDLGQFGTNHSCGGSDYTEIQTATGAAPRYDAPTNGTITSWSVQATSETDVFVKLKMFRPGMVANFLDLIGESSTVGPLTPNTLNGPFATSIPVKAGDVLGLNVVAGSGLGCLFDTADMGDVAEEVNPDPSVVGDTVTTTDVFNPTRVNVAATLGSPLPPTPTPTPVTPKKKKCKKHKKHRSAESAKKKKCTKKKHR